MQGITIRREKKADYRAVENMTREAFWNLNAPGCDEHYLVHVMRKHSDFIAELDLVAELSGKVIGNVMYTKAKLVDDAGNEKEILTFGPVSVLPEFQRRGVGKALLNESFSRAAKMGYDTIVIFGNPGNYIPLGFISCKKRNVYVGNKVFPTAMLVKELKDNALDGRLFRYEESKAYVFDENEAKVFDTEFPVKERQYKKSQEEFYIYSHSTVK